MRRPYVLYRSQIEAQRAEDREAGRRAVEAFLNSVPNSLDRQAAWRWANDHFGMAIQIRGGGTAASRAAPSPRVVAAADKIERGALAGVIANRELLPLLARIPADHFHDEGYRALRVHLVDGELRPPTRRSRCSPSSMPGARRRGSTRRPPRRICSA